MNYLKLLNKDNINDICDYLSLHEILIVCGLRDYIDVELLKKINSKLFDTKLECSICGQSEYVQQSMRVCNDFNTCPLCHKYFCYNCETTCRSLEECDNKKCINLYHTKCFEFDKCCVCDTKLCHSIY